MLYSISQLIFVLSTLLALGCTSIQEKNSKATRKCAEKFTDSAVIICHKEIIFRKMRAYARISEAKLTVSDIPYWYKIKTEIKIDKHGNILDVKFVSKSSSTILNRFVLKSIRRSSPLPVPDEPLFTQGDFSRLHYNLSHYSGHIRTPIEIHHTKK